MGFLSKYKVVIIIVLLAAVGFFVYGKVVVKDPKETAPGVKKESTGKAPPTVSGTAANAEAAKSDESAKAFAAQLRALSDVQIKTEIFKDPAFTVLRADNNTIPPMPSGRPNPFAPIGIDTEGFQQTSVAPGEPAAPTTTAPIRTTRIRSGR